jgi:LAO/AO transport system kinase
MTDVFALLQLPNAGDDLQAIKRGVMEMADVVVINKADIDAAAATRAEAQLTSALRLLHRKPPPVLQASALNEDGIAAFWRTVCELRERDEASGALQRRRHEQDRAWMWGLIEAGLRTRFRTDARVREALPRMTDDVDAGRVAPSVAARQLLDLARP